MAYKLSECLFIDDSVPDNCLMCKDSNLDFTLKSGEDDIYFRKVDDESGMNLLFKWYVNSDYYDLAIEKAKKGNNVEL